MSTEIVKKGETGLVKSDPQELFRQSVTPSLFRDVKNVPAAISAECMSLASIKKAHGEKLSLAIIKTWIINLNDFLNISRKMTPAQIEETAEMIMADFYHYKTSDIALVFQRIKTGYYGQFYESIDGMKILDMFYKYEEERTGYFMNENERKHYDIKSNQ